jgi:uncharacterized membrane protein (DUF485 family)
MLLDKVICCGIVFQIGLVLISFVTVTIYRRANQSNDEAYTVQLGYGMASARVHCW